MYTVPARYVDSVNIACIALTCLAAHLFPYHLVLFSYAVLGPAHYLTQISWMHDRRYFVNSTLAAPAMGVLSLFCTLIISNPDEKMTAESVALCIAIGLSAFWIAPRDKMIVRCLGMAAGLLLGALAVFFPRVSMFLVLLIPTVMHIFVFTAAFMWMGARKSGTKTAYAAVLVLFVSAATFLVPLPAQMVQPDLTGLAFFKLVVLFMQTMLGLPYPLETQLFGFLSFAYTYHYLNWFSKAGVIHWDRISRRRMILIVALYAVTLSVYAYDYTLGFLVIVFLSILHVFLEFPLNLRTFSAIAQGKT